jgi:hypothetical protein
MERGRRGNVTEEKRSTREERGECKNWRREAKDKGETM